MAMDQNRKTCVVLHGRSFIGKSLVLKLLNLGDWIVRIADSPESIRLDPNEDDAILSEALVHDRASYHSVDVRQESQIVTAIEGASVVFYVEPANLCTHDVYICYTVIVQGAKNVINACRKSNVKRLMYNSSADIVFDGSRDICNGDESLPSPWKYEEMLVDLKAQADALVRYANDYDSLLTCVLRPSNVFGPGDTYIVPFLVNHAQSGWPKFIIGSGENMADFTFVENVAHAHICAEEALVSRTSSVAGKAFFITNLEPVKFWKFVSLILEGLGYQRPSVNIPARLALCICSLFKMMHESLGSRKHSLSVSAHYILELASRSRTFNCTAAQKLISYSPIVSLEEGLTSTIKSFSHLSKDSSFSRYDNSSEGSRAEKLLGGGKVADILLWRDEKKTFTYFLAMVLLIYLFFLSGRTFVSSSAYLLILASVFLYVNAIIPSTILGFSTQKISISSFEISEIHTRNSALVIADLWNRRAHNLRSLGEGKDWCLFFKVVASIYFLKMILLNLTAMILFVLVFAFIMFFVYEQYEKEIDEFTITLFNTLKNSMRSLMKNLPASVTPFLHQYGILQDKACTMQKDQQ